MTGIHQATGIPVPTVSRCVANLQKEGHLCERPDPDDGRKRLISLGDISLDMTVHDIDKLAEWFNNYRENGLPS